MCIISYHKLFILCHKQPLRYITASRFLSGVREWSATLLYRYTIALPLPGDGSLRPDRAFAAAAAVEGLDRE